MLGVRQIRGEMKISMAKRIDVILANASDEDLRRLADNGPLLNKLAKFESVRVLAAGEEAPMSATALVGDMQVLVPMAGLIDKEAELARLDKEIQRLDGEVKRVGGKLANEGFVAKARPRCSTRSAPSSPRPNRPWPSWPNSAGRSPTCKPQGPPPGGPCSFIGKWKRCPSNCVSNPTSRSAPARPGAGSPTSTACARKCAPGCA